MQVIVKTTERCNGTCAYCSADSGSRSGQTFPRERLGAMFGTFRRWLDGDPRRTVGFIWHGGEPMLAGRDFFAEVLEQQQRVFGDERARLSNAMQSNLSLLDDGWLGSLRELCSRGTVGSSFDPVKRVRGLADGGDLPDLWLRARTRLEAAGIRVGVVYVVHRRSLDRAADIYRFFRNLNPDMAVRYNPIYAEGRGGRGGAAKLLVTAEQYGDFLVDLLEAWERDGRSGLVQPLKEWHAVWTGRGSRMCCDSSGSCFRTHLGVTAGGELYGCGRAADNGATELALGSVFDADLEGLLSRQPRTRLAARGDTLRSGRCAGCSYWGTCHGGCPVMALLYHGDLLRESYFCEARKRVFGRFEELYGPPASPRPIGRPREDRAAKRSDRPASVETP